MRVCISIVLTILVIITLIIILVSNFLATKRQVHIYAVDLQCYNVDTEFVHLEKCQLSQYRGRRGVIDGFGTFKTPLDDIWINLKFLCKDSDGIFQKHIVNMNFDVCDAHNYLIELNPLRKAILKFSDKILQPPVMTQVAKGCPIEGPVNVTDFEFERDIKEYISPFFHDGTFMIYLRFYTKANATYIEIQTTLEVRASNIRDYITEYITPM